MDKLNTAYAGSLESGDLYIMVKPNDVAGREINIDSIVKVQFGDAILKTINEVLDDFNIKDIIVEVNDKGALDSVIRARMEAALCRACGIEKYKWRMGN